MCRLRYYHRVSKGFVPLFLCRDGGALFTLLDLSRVFSNKDFMVVNLHMYLYGVDWSHGTLLALLNTFIFNSLSPLVGYREIFQRSGCASIGLLRVHRVSKVFVSHFIFPVELVTSSFGNQHIYKRSGCKPRRYYGAPFNPLSPLAGYMVVWDRSIVDRVGCISIGLLSVIHVRYSFFWGSSHGICYLSQVLSK